MRYRREHASGRQLPFFPLLEDLMRDVCDGAALLTVVHSYCPDHIKLEGEFTSSARSRFREHKRQLGIFRCGCEAAPLAH